MKQLVLLLLSIACIFNYSGLFLDTSVLYPVSIASYLSVSPERVQLLASCWFWVTCLGQTRSDVPLIQPMIFPFPPFKVLVSRCSIPPCEGRKGAKALRLVFWLSALSPLVHLHNENKCAFDAWVPVEMCTFDGYPGSTQPLHVVSRTPRSLGFGKVLMSVSLCWPMFVKCHNF